MVTTIQFLTSQQSSGAQSSAVSADLDFNYEIE